MDNTINIVVCDDEPIFIEEIKRYLTSELNRQNIKYNIYEVTNGFDLLDTCEKQNIDAVFLDISMPEINGYETAERLRETNEDIEIVFVSGNETLVFSSYEYNPLWFVPKSQMHLMKKVADRLIEKVQKRKISSAAQLIHIGNKIVKIDVRKISYFRTDSHYVNYFDCYSVKSESFRCKLNDIQEQLNDYWFIRPHNRFLVNLRMVRCISDGNLILSDSTEIPISRININPVKEKFQKYMRSSR